MNSFCVGLSTVTQLSRIYVINYKSIEMFAVFEIKGVVLE